MRSTTMSILAGALLLGNAAQACTCADWPTSEEALAASSAVFSGRIIQVADVVAPNRWPMKVALMTRIDCWKGTVPDRPIVWTEENDAVCGYDFHTGEEYLVYAKSTTLGFYVDLCWRVLLLRGAGADLALLGTPDCTVAVQPTTWGGIKALFGSSNR